jgi:hypothetical protein
MYDIVLGLSENEEVEVPKDLTFLRFSASWFTSVFPLALWHSVLVFISENPQISEVQFLVPVDPTILENIFTKNCCNLRRLFFYTKKHSNGICNSNPTLFSGLKNNTNLTSLTLCHCVDTSIFGNLCESLAENSSVTFLDISRNKLTDNNIIAIGNLLSKNSTLKNLVAKEIVNNSKEMYRLLKYGKLTSLVIPENKLFSFKIFAQYLSENKILETLSIEIYEDKNFYEFILGFSKNSTLKNLFFSSQQLFTNKNFLELGQAFTKHKTLENLYLPWPNLLMHDTLQVFMSMINSRKIPTSLNFNSIPNTLLKQLLETCQKAMFFRVLGSKEFEEMQSMSSFIL